MWTKKEAEYIKRNYRKISDKDMAEKLNRGKREVSYIRALLGFKRDFRDCEHMKDRLIYVRANMKDKSDKEISEKLGISPQTVSKLRLFWGYSKKTTNVGKEKQKEVKELRALGGTLREIEKKTGLTYATVRKILDEGKEEEEDDPELNRELNQRKENRIPRQQKEGILSKGHRLHKNNVEKFNLVENKNYNLLIKYEWGSRKFKGKCIKNYKDFILFKSKTRLESFSKIEFIGGNIVVN